MIRRLLIIGWAVLACTPALAVDQSGKQGGCLDVCTPETGLAFVACMKSCRADEFPLRGGPLGEGYDWSAQGRAWTLVMSKACAKGDENCLVHDQAIQRGGKNIAHPCALNPDAPGCQRPVPETGIYLHSCKNDFNRLLKDPYTGGAVVEVEVRPQGRKVLWAESAGLVYHPQQRDGRADDRMLVAEMGAQGQYLVKDGHVFLPGQDPEKPAVVMTGVQPYPYASHDACFCPADCRLTDFKREYCPSGFMSASTGQCCPNDCR